MTWIREYQKYPSNLSPKRAFAARNLLAEGLERWLVPEIFAALPFLLQTALALFLVGLADFLLHSNTVVAAPAVAMIVATLIFLLITTAAPSLQAVWIFNITRTSSIPIQCPYKSPRSWAFLRLTSSKLSRSVWYTLREIIVFTMYSGLLNPIRLASWNDFDGFWLDARQRLYTKSSVPSTFFSKMVANIDCDAARGIAHVVDGRAQDDAIATTIYHCFQQLPTSVNGDDVFQRMTLRLPEWMSSSSTSRKCVQLHRIDDGMVRAENEMFLLGRLPQTTIIDPLHVFRKRQLILFVKVVAYIFGSNDIRAASYLRTTEVTNGKKMDSVGKLFIPTCLKTVEGFESLPRPLSEGIQQDLAEVFDNLVKRAAAFGNDDYSSNLCFQEVLGDFMQLVKVVMMCGVLSASTNHQQMDYIGRILDSLARSASKRARTRRTCVVYLSMLFVSRFSRVDWAPIKQRSPRLAVAFEDLVDILNGLGMTDFSFSLKGSVYRRQCEGFVKEVQGPLGSSQQVRQEHRGGCSGIIVNFSTAQDGPGTDYHKHITLAVPDPVRLRLTPGNPGVKIKRYSAIPGQNHPVNYCDTFVEIPE
ncbi:hypothetical protein D9619_004761 [Psilocybe cf. subviscida]|uniref:DUF6535 domain-containing protein n=1 Tax=Psilocybe cf. subviscida TaxID=2480587 RepID=A0A8H5BPZ8_9AGAR|nr:hypothetical protein D9619_004761 [Psilocybe cf. subviscida]